MDDKQGLAELRKPGRNQILFRSINAIGVLGECRTEHVPCNKGKILKGGVNGKANTCKDMIV